MLAAVAKTTREIFLSSESIQSGEDLEIHYYSPTKEVVNLILMDVTGGILYQSQRNCQEGLTRFKIAGLNWPAGSYKLSVVSESDCLTKSIQLR